MEHLLNKIHHADCLEFMKLLPDKCVDLVLTDPPYGIGMDGGNVGYKGFNNFEQKEWDSLTPDQQIFDEITRVSRNQIIWGGNYFNLPSTRGFLIWDKGEGFYNRSYAECEQAWTSFDKNAKIFKYDPLAKGDYKGKYHPTQKPLQLFKWCLQYSGVGGIVFDPFSGSGTTALACHDLGLDFICVEKDPDYHAASVKRLEAHQRQLKLI